MIKSIIFMKWKYGTNLYSTSSGRNSWPKANLALQLKRRGEEHGLLSQYRWIVIFGWIRISYRIDGKLIVSFFSSLLIHALPRSRRQRIERTRDAYYNSLLLLLAGWLAGCFKAHWMEEVIAKIKYHIDYDRYTIRGRMLHLVIWISPPQTLDWASQRIFRWGRAV